MPRPQKGLEGRFFPYFVLASAIVFGAWSSVWLWAEINAVMPKQYMKDLEQGLAKYSEKTHAAAVEDMTSASRINPFSADYVADLGRLADWQAFQYSVLDTKGQNFRGRARYYYERALLRRSTWGYIWIHSSQARILNQKLDAISIAEFEKALLLGPLETGVQKKIVWLGLALRDRLDVEVWERTLKIIEYAFHAQPEYVSEAAVHFGWDEHLDAWVESDYERAMLKQERIQGAQ